ncbi:hypothetical protein L1987_61102 [Smallanthus sonchifolius]|uniref:Uncharacterized protein n=1 Tax=Smallanthus sonchifolius TaxID=185202 RepID=A0ACB9D9T5_9ASTR|nr:hypothetical protein L1987_61102 [Smallanthus sonchifolius]
MSKAPGNVGESGEIACIGEPYRENDGSMSVGSSVCKDNNSVTTMTRSFVKEDGNNISMDAFNEHNNSSPMDLCFQQAGSMTALVLQGGLYAITSSVQRSEEKESSLAATRELQMICGKEEAKVCQRELTWSSKQ